MNGEYSREEFLAGADSLLAQGSYEEVLALSKERLKIFPGDPDATMVICQASLGKNDFDEAQTALKALEKLHLRLARVYKAMGDACLSKGMNREALAYFQKGMILIPEPGEASQVSRTMADALDAFGQVSDPDDDPAEDVDSAAPIPDFYTLTMADLYLKQGHLDQAIEVLEAMHRQDPQNESVMERLREVKAQMQGVPGEGSPGEPSGEAPPVEELPGAEPESPGETVAEELSRWLRNISKVRPDDTKVSQNA